jgi:hypothetical protein
LEEDVPERVAPAALGFPQRREFHRVQAVWCYAEHLRKPVFLLRRYSIHAEYHVGVQQRLCRKSFSLGKSSAKAFPGDAIFEKFEFKMNFKLKINVKQDRTNFISIH